MDGIVELSHLWIGNLKPFMSKEYLQELFTGMGFPLLDVVVITNRVLGEPLYGFLQFKTVKDAQTILYEYDNKPIPGVKPVTKFFLNVCGSVVEDRRPYFGIWMGNLRSEIKECDIEELFVEKQLNLKRFYLVKNNCGISKCYGFAEFDNQQDKQQAISVIKGYIGFGRDGMPLVIRNAAGAMQQVSSQPNITFFTLRLRNVLGRTKEQDLDDFFSKRFASYVGAKLPRSEHNTPKELAFIRFKDKSDLNAAYQMLKETPRFGNKNGLKLKIVDNTPMELQTNKLTLKSQEKGIQILIKELKKVLAEEEVEEKGSDKE
ncbi:tRNA selenocysteine 1-associated protein 1-like [Teleopsis dalmanni]|uniref:tRNA selenocysteine 1-associated protein 1-like n=1 Tax=Teleopsis dalmanni TaxID=139649 RepID=UPI000D32B695|nr:tRNA selenocysteine 1-associated protein 1-like [Teleopsis dalmanni]